MASAQAMTGRETWGSPGARALDSVVQETAEWCAAQYGTRVRALVLTGSVARGEATVITEGNRSRLLGDAEFLLVFHPGSPLPSTAEVQALQGRIQSALADRQIAAAVTLSASHPDYLAKLRPHIFAYELRTCGRVVFGDPGILGLIPSFPVSAIPLEDAWRLLSNRLVEQLELADELAAQNGAAQLDGHYRTVKLYLDMATSLLLFAGDYKPTYRERAERLSQLAAVEPPGAQWPFPLSEFSTKVATSTRLKLERSAADPTGAAGEPAATISWGEALSYARTLWRWELACLTRADPRLPDRELLRRWMRAQPLRQRLRGWLYVARRLGWRHSLRHWLRWAQHARYSSPRYCVYAAACELTFRLPSLARAAVPDPSTEPDWDEVRGWLPVTPAAPSLPRRAPWQGLAADIVWNYREFLVDTRS